MVFLDHTLQTLLELQPLPAAFSRSDLSNAALPCFHTILGPCCCVECVAVCCAVVNNNNVVNSAPGSQTTIVNNNVNNCNNYYYGAQIVLPLPLFSDCASISKAMGCMRTL